MPTYTAVTSDDLLDFLDQYGVDLGSPIAAINSLRRQARTRPGLSRVHHFADRRVLLVGPETYRSIKTCNEEAVIHGVQITCQAFVDLTDDIDHGIMLDALGMASALLPMFDRARQRGADMSICDVQTGLGFDYALGRIVDFAVADAVRWGD